MNHLDIVHGKMRLANLEAQRERYEIERDALTREINSGRNTPPEQEQAIVRRSHLLTEWAKTDGELQSLYGAIGV